MTHYKEVHLFLAVVGVFTRLPCSLLLYAVCMREWHAWDSRGLQCGNTSSHLRLKCKVFVKCLHECMDANVDSNSPIVGQELIITAVSLVIRINDPAFSGNSTVCYKNHSIWSWSSTTKSIILYGIWQFIYMCSIGDAADYIRKWSIYKQNIDKSPDCIFSYLKSHIYITTNLNVTLTYSVDVLWTGCCS